MREYIIEHFSDVKSAMLEINGNISIISGEKNLRQTHYSLIIPLGFKEIGRAHV